MIAKRLWISSRVRLGQAPLLLPSDDVVCLGELPQGREQELLITIGRRIVHPLLQAISGQEVQEVFTAPRIQVSA